MCKRFTMFTGPRRGKPRTMCRGHAGGVPGEWAHPSRWGAKREWGPVDKRLYWGVRWSTEVKGVSEFHWGDWKPLGHREGKKGSMWQGPVLSPGHLGRGLTVYLWESSGIRKTWSFTILQYCLVPLKNYFAIKPFGSNEITERKILIIFKGNWW